MSVWQGGPRLLADVGGTNIRFALESAPQQFDHVRVLQCADYATLEAATAAYLAAPQVRAAGAISHAAIAIATAVEGDVVGMTNHHWRFSTAALRGALALDTLLVVNDFTALAMALPHLQARQLVKIGGGAPRAGRGLGLVGPGTGLGVSGLVPFGARWAALASEGGHVSLAPAGGAEMALLAALQEQFGHVSAERLLCGSGLELIYATLSGNRRDAAAISAGALDGSDPFCLRAVEQFCALLGSVAGNVALTLGATGGMYIGGGIVPRFGALFAESRFRARFEDKGRLAPYLARIPTYLITEPFPAFLGIAALLAEHLH